MKGWSLALAALALALTLSLLLSAWSTGAKAEVHQSPEVHPLPLSKTSSSHQALKDLQAHRKNPSKQVDSSFRRIPPSKSNPTQNKFNPPTDG